MLAELMRVWLVKYSTPWWGHLVAAAAAVAGGFDNRDKQLASAKEREASLLEEG